jgi:hypothetical protein
VYQKIQGLAADWLQVLFALVRFVQVACGKWNPALMKIPVKK